MRVAGMEGDPAHEFMGPRLRALPNDLRRRFAVLMGAGELNPTEAAREAGYSDIKEGAKVQAHHLMHNAEVLAAIEEVAGGHFRSLAPKAISAARAILENPRHRAHARMIEAVLDRTGFAAQTEHKVTVQHSVDMRELEALARRLAVENGIAPERFVGLNGPAVIEGEVVDEKTT